MQHLILKPLELISFFVAAYSKTNLSHWGKKIAVADDRRLQHNAPLGHIQTRYNKYHKSIITCLTLIKQKLKYDFFSSIHYNSSN